MMLRSPFSEKYSTVIGVVMRGGEYLECVLRSQVTIDGTEATAICTSDDPAFTASTTAQSQ